MRDIYITYTSGFLPNDPIDNNEIEDYMGLLGGKPSRAKSIVLRNNGIKRRFYALDKKGAATHTNAQISAEAVRTLMNQSGTDFKDIQLLTCGTSSPDQMMPSHGVEVHGSLPEAGPIEVVSPSGNCCAGMYALKYAYLSLASGGAENAVAVGSERTSKLLHANMFAGEVENNKNIKGDPYIAFEKDFLRWMLSDGAGAALLSAKKPEKGISLKIDWIEGVSYAHEVEACMYMASDKEENGELKSFKDYTPQQLVEESIFSIKQDVKLLQSNIIALGFKKLKEIFTSKNIGAEDVDYFLPHMSSEFFRAKIANSLSSIDEEIPQEKWFTNLSMVGNVGAASPYLMLDELMKSGRLKVGDKILIAVPESARFSYVFAFLTVS